MQARRCLHVISSASGRLIGKHIVLPVTAHISGFLQQVSGLSLVPCSLSCRKLSTMESWLSCGTLTWLRQTQVGQGAHGQLPNPLQASSRWQGVVVATL